MERKRKQEREGQVEEGSDIRRKLSANIREGRPSVRDLRI